MVRLVIGVVTEVFMDNQFKLLVLTFVPRFLRPKLLRVWGEVVYFDCFTKEKREIKNLEEIVENLLTDSRNGVTPS